MVEFSKWELLAIMDWARAKASYAASRGDAGAEKYETAKCIYDKAFDEYFEMFKREGA